MSNTAAEVLSTITTIDTNTTRQITWNIVHSYELGLNVQSQYGWTHTLALVRPNGRGCFYSVNVEMIGDVVVRRGAVTKAFR
jgi:hypothetical protein